MRFCGLVLFIVCCIGVAVLPLTHGARGDRTLDDRVFSLESQVHALQLRAKGLEKELRDEKRASSIVIGEFVKALNTLHFKFEQHKRDGHVKE